MPESRLGELTVPIGLAVVGGGLAQLAGPLALDGAALAVSAAWVASAILVAWVVLPAKRTWSGVGALEGTWFLVPATFLADGIGVGILAGRGPTSLHQPLGWLALVSVGTGVLGYGAVLILAALRVARSDLGRVAGAPWWIAAGCGGLAAAAVGRLGSAGPWSETSALRHAVGLSAFGLWVVASAVAIPVLIGSAAYLWRLRSLAGHPPWPPTFSTGVYALGATQAGHLLALEPVTSVARLAASATVLLWSLTILAHLPAVTRSRLPGRPR